MFNMKTCCRYLFLFVLMVITSGTVTIRCGERGSGIQNSADGVCGNVDIRNDVRNFVRLENCTVIEGYLHISLIERIQPGEMEQLSFPALREITDHLMLFRVYELKSLRKLLPNLAIIRGRNLFNNYALVAYEMRDLEEIGLVNLRTINRGGVRLTKNKKLCYIETVDWTRIGVDPVAQDFKDNKEESQCANYCPDECPTTKVKGVEAKRCWTSQHCQMGLNCKCQANQTCMDDGSCCHEYCLGGCSGPGIGDCFSCKGVVYEGKCHPQCPPRTYTFFDRRCLTDKECLNMKDKTQHKGGDAKLVQADRHNPSKCVFTCPENTTIREEGELKGLECVKCEGFCPKVCNGTDVNSIEDAQRLRSCSKIVGPLVIQIMGGSNVAQEMERNLGSIKEVTGYINIRRSYALLTLYFFTNLEIIGGETSTHQGHSLIVMDNSNLQELFPEEQMKKMKILNGKVSFHGNRNLCLYKIYNFVKYLNLTQAPTDQDISPATNGDLKPCTEHQLNLSVSMIYYNSVVLMWEKDTGDTRQLLTYIIYYREIKDPDENVNIYQGRDACSDDTWMTSEQPPTEGPSPNQTGVIFNLKAYTSYAAYVQAYTLSTATHSAMTNPVVFTTNPYYPTEPTDLEVSSDNPHELHVKWKPPKFPNGIVTHYKVIYQKQELNKKNFEPRNYCLDPNTAPKETPKDKVEEEEKKQNLTANCCACPKSKEELEAEARKREIEVYFENHLHAQVYCKRYDTLPEDVRFSGIDERFSLPELSVIAHVGDLDDTWDRGNASFSKDGKDLKIPYLTNSSKNNSTVSADMQDSKNQTQESQEVIVYGTEIFLPNLEHFQEYSIEVQACQETHTEDSIRTKLCSNRAITLGRTKASWMMDVINTTTIEVDMVTNSSGDVLIKWEPPPRPNGLILKYNLLYKRSNQENLVPQQVCVDTRLYQKVSGYRLTGLEPGNWTFQINAVSLAGNSSFTPEKFFIVPHTPGEEDSNKVFIAIIVIVSLVLIIIVIVIVFIVAKNKLNNDEMTVISPNINYVPTDPMYTMDAWEVDRDKIKLIKELGQGSFGMVYEGVAKGLGDDSDEEIRVAVKTVNDRANFNDRREFLKEATTMKAFDTFHVVKLLGVVSTGQPALVIMELMALGDLKNYLREHRPDEQERPGVSPPRLLDILQMAGEIADGMAYLADKKFVHRDLAARNCMVAEDRTVKIGDFGMTRDIYETDYYRKGGKGMLPVRWMAPESLRDGVFTSASDVWSYGVVMWEMVTLAAQPYQGLSNEEVVKYISEGSTMDMPDKCPQEMAFLMQRCWAKKPNDRPTFKQIIEYLLPNLNARFEKVSYFFKCDKGPAEGAGGMGATGQLEGEESDDNSINSLSCEGAAAPRLGHGEMSGRDYQFRNSPNPSAGSTSLYDDGLDPVEFMDGDGAHYAPQNLELSLDNFEDADCFNSHSDFGMDLDDSNQPFMSEVPSVMLRQPALLAHEPNGSMSGPRGSGLIELQPLISRDQGPSPTRLNNVQSSSPYSSEYIGHQPPTLNLDPKPLGGPQSPHQQNPFSRSAADPLRSGPPPSEMLDGAGSSAWPTSRPSAANPTPSSGLPRPTLRLPTLNQPPSGGFRRVPLFNAGDRFKDTNSSRGGEPTVGSRSTPNPASLAPSTMVSMEVDQIPAGDTSPTSAARNCSPPPGAIPSSSEGSKESSKSSGSHSLINGLTNGHIPLPSVRHRTAPC